MGSSLLADLSVVVAGSETVSTVFSGEGTTPVDRMSVYSAGLEDVNSFGVTSEEEPAGS